MDTLACWLRLQLTPGLGRAGLFRLIDHYHSPQAAIAAAGTGSWPGLAGTRQGLPGRLPAADDPRLAEGAARLAALDAWLLTYWDAAYPSLLRNIPDPPALLYGRGARTSAKHWPSSARGSLRQPAGWPRKPWPMTSPRKG